MKEMKLFENYKRMAAAATRKSTTTRGRLTLKGNEESRREEKCKRKSEGRGEGRGKGKGKGKKQKQNLLVMNTLQYETFGRDLLAQALGMEPKRSLASQCG